MVTSDVDAQEKLNGEPDLAPIMCVHCQAELDGVEEPWPDTCPDCGHEIDLETQFAYIRGRDAFIVGQDILLRLTPKMRRRNLVSQLEMESLQYYTQAYSSLQRAFQGHLAESQRQLAIEMMAAMTQVFGLHGVISPFESSYWTTLMIELTSQLEVIQIREKLTSLPAGLMGAVLQLRWQARLRQLEKALAQLDVKIKTLERNIVFVERPNARRKLA